ncbi:MAG: septation protein A [Alphaproteobacteria bacterium]|nr:septation protein A [Alphaproteobacteria bacterium]
MPPLAKVALDLGPLLIFFGVNAKFGIMAATGAFMAAMAVSLAVSFFVERRFAPMPLVTGVIVLVFGGLTLLLEDDTFIKLKPTIVNGIFVTVLGVGLLRRRLYIKLLFEEAFHLHEAAWRTLTVRWMCFFLFLAILNEIVWRNFSTDDWVSFKVWGIFPLTLLFTVLQVPFILRHQITPEEAHEESESSETTG